jgi:hypothetical protein
LLRRRACAIVVVSHSAQHRPQDAVATDDGGRHAAVRRSIFAGGLLAARPDVHTFTNPVLRDYHEQLEAVRLDARDLTASMTPAQFNWRASPRRWSVGQCLEHLVLTARIYPEPIEAMIREARERQVRREPPYREGLLARYLIYSMEPPPGLRVRSPRRVEPRDDLDVISVPRNFDELHARLGNLIAAADGVSLAHGRMASPFLPLLKLTLGQVFAVNLAHARRHLWQARQVMRLQAFPSA